VSIGASKMTADHIQDNRPTPADILPLAGLRVLDLTWLLPGPFGTHQLAELGADVLKIERPHTGDYMREMFPDLFELVNRNKRSIALDLKSEQGRQVFLKLAGKADVVIESFRPGVTKRLGIDYDNLKDLKSDLIYVSISGYGQDGPYAHRPGHDVNYLALAGGLSTPGQWGEAPCRSGLPVADLAGALYAVTNILAALRSRDITGQGAFIDLAITDAVLHWAQVRFGSRPTSEESEWHHLHPTNDVFHTADDRGISLALIEEKFWNNFCHAIGRVDLLERYPSIGEVAHDRVHSYAIRNVVAEVIRSEDLRHWCEIFEGADIPFAPVNGPDEVFADPHFAARGTIVRDDSGTPTVLLPGRLTVHHGRGHAPNLGENTDEVLADIGLGDGEIAELRRIAAIA